MSGKSRESWNPESFVQDAQPGIPPAPTLVEEENLEVGRLYGPDGSLLAIVRARATVPFGFTTGH